jgi:hypothetical protein
VVKANAIGPTCALSKSEWRAFLLNDESTRGDSATTSGKFTLETLQESQFSRENVRNRIRPEAVVTCSGAMFGPAQRALPEESDEWEMESNCQEMFTNGSDVQLPAAPVPALGIPNVPDPGHFAEELRHWTVLLDFLRQGPLSTKCFVRCHLRRRTKTARFLRYDTGSARSTF